MKKLRIINLQSSTFLMEALKLYLGTDRLILEEDDIDLTEIDTLIGYVMEQPHSDHMGYFDAECPDSLPVEVEPEYDIDAGNFLEFLFKLVNIGIRMSREGAVPIAWIQFPAIRGADALFMTQWALAGHYYTKDPRFLDFLDSLMEEVEYWGVIDTMGSFYSPKWCRPHFGPSLLYPTLWNIQNRVDPNKYAKYWNKLAFFIAEEIRYKDIVDANDVYFGILYNTMINQGIDPDGHDYALDMVDMLRDTGQLAVVDKFEPRRNYSVDLISNPEPGLLTEDLSQEEYDMCMQNIVILGIEIPLGSLEDELPRATKGMPIPWRVPGSFQWQMDPFMLYRDYGQKEGRVQWPMQGFSVAYWTGRMQGVIPEGKGKALGWKETENSCK